MKVTDITYEYPKYLGEFRGQEKLSLKVTLEEGDNPVECIKLVKEMVYGELGINGTLSGSPKVPSNKVEFPAGKEVPPSADISNGEGEKDGSEHATASSSNEGSKEVSGDSVKADGRKPRKPRTTKPSGDSKGPEEALPSGGASEPQPGSEPSNVVNFNREILDHRKLISMELMAIIEPKYGKEANKNEKVKAFIPKIVADCANVPFATMVGGKLSTVPSFQTFLKETYEKHDK